MGPGCALSVHLAATLTLRRPQSAVHARPVTSARRWRVDAPCVLRARGVVLKQASASNANQGPIQQCRTTAALPAKQGRGVLCVPPTVKSARLEGRVDEEHLTASTVPQGCLVQRGQLDVNIARRTHGAWKGQATALLTMLELGTLCARRIGRISQRPRLSLIEMCEWLTSTLDSS